MYRHDLTIWQQSEERDRSRKEDQLKTGNMGARAPPLNWDNMPWALIAVLIIGLAIFCVYAYNYLDVEDRSGKWIMLVGLPDSGKTSLFMKVHGWCRGAHVGYGVFANAHTHTERDAGNRLCYHLFTGDVGRPRRFRVRH